METPNLKPYSAEDETVAAEPVSDAGNSPVETVARDIDDRVILMYDPANPPSRMY